MFLYCSVMPASSAAAAAQLSRALTMFWSRSARSNLRNESTLWIQDATLVPVAVGSGPIDELR